MTVLFHTFQKIAQAYHNKTAIISDNKHYTYQALEQLSLQWSATLASLSSTPRVALLTEAPLNTAALSLAIAKLGTTCVPTNPQLTKEQLASGWQATDVSIVIYEQEFSAKVQQCMSLPSMESVQFINVEALIEQAKQGSSSIKSTEQNASDNKHTEHSSDQDDFIITLSSGSTGAPKPIALSQQSKLSRAQQSWQLYDINETDTVLCASPFFHSLGQRLFFVPLLKGCTLVHLKHFTPQRWLLAVENHKVSKVISVSSHLYALKDELLLNAKQLQSLKTIVTSSAPIDNHFKEQLFNAVGCDFHEMYGATEVATATNLYPKYAKEKHTSVGTPCPNVAIKILDEDKSELPCNSIGEIAVKSPLVFNGYYHKKQLTQSSFKDGYFLTGDLGKIAQDGFLTYVGRKKDIIISGGINIYPKDIETTIAKHQAVKEVAVIGVDDKFLGEVILAVCVAQFPAETDQQQAVKSLEKELRRVANKTLAPFQRPLKYYFEQSLPLTASGKTSKLLLREQYNSLDEDWSAPLRAMLFR
ncbi:class I adenylate-forming enzyme family protein [Litorilituus lipolyticus]|uniref:Long-chain fatty acid--CoA ligase n=1 Tax=Litorilituus lipolyticus TaxID=2491017 RepID=A0A502L4G9_9GAMM|nr:class I adenylate-forming enzyme family protein [Litorilituus lipolyticus]TPH17151.1 long-chain fatty acid--CoA ligase [Litorilituus lipolyticus]